MFSVLRKSTLFLALFALVSFASAQTPVTGTFSEAGGLVANGSVSFILQNCGALPSTGNSLYTFSLNASGVISGAVQGNNGNGCLTSGGTNQSYFQVTLLDSNQTLLWRRYFQVPVQSTPWNLATATPMASLPPPLTNGVAGPPGSSATISIGNVNTVDNDQPATVTNSGTDSAAVLNFNIPKGPPGTVGGVTVTGPPSARYIPIAIDSTTGQWGQLTQDDILPGFTIASFTGGSTVEVGTTVTNPAFIASYSSTPASATITNTDSIGSPLALVSPFTHGTVTGAFKHTTVSAATFTLNATSGVTKAATSAISWQPRTFAGVGAAGATGATAAGTTAVLTGTTGTLPSAGLNNQTTYAATPSAQKVYILMTGGTHTFKDASTGFAFAFNTPTSVSFVNANGSTIAMFLYESTNTLTGTFSIQVVS